MKYFIICILLMSLNSYSHNLRPIDEKSYNIDTLRVKFGKNKSIPKQLEKKILIALSFFPELQFVHIDFVFSKMKLSMSTRPSIKSLFKNGLNRKYYVFINSDSTCVVQPFRASFSAQVGCFAHELSHISDYCNMTGIELIRMGIGYFFSKSYKKNIETRTDTIAVKHGIGFSVYEYSKFIFYEAGIDKSYLDFKKKCYLTPEEILNMAKQFNKNGKIHNKVF